MRLPGRIYWGAVRVARICFVVLGVMHLYTERHRLDFNEAPWWVVLGVTFWCALMMSPRESDNE